MAATLGKKNPFRYRGYYYDEETGLYYLRGRYYDPKIKRFISSDDSDILDGGNDHLLENNLFAFCFNNPVNFSDDAGYWPKWATKLLVGTAIIAAVAVVTVATAGTGTALACASMGALKGAVIGAASGAAQGAITGAIGHRLTTGGWEGAGAAALNGAADGYLTGTISGGITGALTSPVCFVAGTAVLTSEGLKKIEDICVGDLVWSEDPETGEKAQKKVVQTFVNETKELVHIFVNGEEIVTTPEHPFYVKNQGWTGARHLCAKDRVVLYNGNSGIVEKIQHEKLKSPVKVYNFEVADFHTYFVGKHNILVHNICIINKNGVKVEVRTLEHGIPHGHVTGNGPKTTIGLDGNPMKSHPPLSSKQKKVIKENWKEVEDGIRKYFPKQSNR